MALDIRSIYDSPPPELHDLKTALHMARTGPQNYWTALLIGAATATYTRSIRDHYDRYHNSGGEECDCGGVPDGSSSDDAAIPASQDR